MMHFKSGLELTELQNMTVPEDDNISNDSNDFTEVENGQINSKFISDRESRRSLTNSHLEKKKCDEYIPGTTSLGMSVFNLSNAIMGSGILGLAFALANTGILLFLILLTSVTLLSIYSINLLLICSKETGCMVYEKLGEQVFGTTGKLVIFGATSLQNTGAMLSYLFIVKNELPSAIKFLMGKEETFWDWYVDGRVLVVIVTFGIILPLCLLKNLGYLGYTSGFSLSCMVFFLIVVIYKKFKLPCIVPELNSTLINNSTNADMCTPKYVTFNSKLEALEGVLGEMISCSVFMLSVTIIPSFGQNVHSDLLHKYQSKDDILILTVRLAVIVAVILTVPVLFFTVRSSLFELAKKTKFNLCRHILVTFILLVIINLLVIFIPSMKDIFGVVGVTSANMLIFILPSSLYLKITNQDGDKGTQRVWAALFLGLGVLFSLVSIPLVIYDWACSSSSDEGR
ncbi:sodium-coupled neutral amino acid transporter 1 [Orycteropus afer afer]|uniref:Sodium-coupled neutral amino acid transporter 1 n=1 Tax=Orycteropus afer afer TaxID=1230840 RepID=A0A8B6ZM51_ORYAF|nr:sodium-coupled neutral amino acid transporter 1 [Orycteropus afer afer]